MVGEQCVAATVRADELADGAREEQPSERVIPLAPDRRIPIAALGTPITAAMTPLATCCDSTLSGIAAANDSTATTPSAIAQARGDPNPHHLALWSGPLSTLTKRTLRADRSENVTVNLA